MWKKNFEFFALKLIDDATLFSKEEVIKEYEHNKDAENLNELLHEKSIYPNGEKLGFYNISKFKFNDFLEKKYSEEEFKEYLQGFSIEVQELLNIITPDYSKFYDDFMKEFFINISSINKKYSMCKESIQNVFIDKYFNERFYFNYKEYSSFLKKVLFCEVELKDNISILDIYPLTPFVFQCLNYISMLKPECDVNLYVISKSNADFFPLKFLAIINKVNFKYIISERFPRESNTDYNELFNNNTFDFVIDSEKLNKSRINTFDIVTNFNAYNYSKIFSNIKTFGSSKIIYIVPFSNDRRIYKKWLENDILESLILIPIQTQFNKSPVVQLESELLFVLNYNKSEERKNKFIMIDHTPNKIITTAEYSIEKYSEFINNANIYEMSYKQFLNFAPGNNSKIISIEDILNNMKCDEDRIYINFNDLLYDVKMNVQKKYYQIEYHEKDSSNKEHIVRKQLNYDIEKLKNLVKPDNKSNEFRHHLYFLTNQTNVDKWVFLDSEIKNRDVYSQMKLISDKVSLGYLYYYLNSQVGINEYDYFKRGSKKGLTRKTFFNEIRVPIPPKDVQAQIVNAMNKCKTFFNEINQLKNTINSHFFDYSRNLNTINEFYGNRIYSEETQEVLISNNWEYALSGLVWPLAITYLLATSGGFEKVEKANNLLRFFEFTAAFNAIVLISGLPEKIYETYKTRIWEFAYAKGNNIEKFKKSLMLSFGSWVEFNNILSGVYKKKFQTELNKEFYVNLSNKKIRKILNKLKDERNNQFHGSIKNASEAEIFLNEINIFENEIFNELNKYYNNFKLYYITGRYDYKTKEYDVIFLNGPYSMPIYSKVVYDGELDPESLYLHNVAENIFSKLNDNLIKFEAIDETKRDWRLYIFIGFETKDNIKKAKYRCYQREEEDLFEDVNLNEFM